MSATAVLTAHANPYVGPRAFRTGEQLYGRDRELRRLLDLLIAERIVLLFAPSGAGKTSLVQAALIPRLAAEGFAVLPPIRVNQELSAQLALAPVSPPPPADPGDELLAALIGQVSAPVRAPNGSSPPRNSTTYTALTGPNRYLLSAMLSLEEARPPEARLPVAELAALSFDAYLQRREADYPEADGVVLVFDQFEELLTLNTADRPAKEQFFTQVGAALLSPNRWALFSMREDFVGAMEPYQRFVPTQLANTFRLDLLGVRAARESMQLPVQAQGVVFTDAAAAQLVDNLRLVRVLRPDGVTEEQLGPFVEPVQLQVVCYRLWARLDPDDRSIDPEDVAALGDVESALTDYYAERVATIAAATGVSERAIRDWCEHSLITEQGIRGQVALGAGGGLPETAVRALVDAHLVRAEPRRGAIWCELAHDRLINPVRQDNTRWRAEHLSPLQTQATLWARQDRQPGLLLRGEALAEAERWAATGEAALTPDEQEFLEASRALRAAEEREHRNARRVRLLALVSAVAALAAVVLAVWAVVERGNAQVQTRFAEGQARIAQEQAQLAEVRALLADQRQASAEEMPQRALLLAVEAFKRERAYRTSLGDPETALRQSLYQVNGVGLRGPPAGVPYLFYGPGDWVYGVDEDGGLWRWPSGQADGEPVAQVPFSRSGLSGEPRSAFVASADGSVAAISEQRGRLWLWRTADGAAPAELVIPPVERFLALSDDGRWLVVSASGRLRVFDLQLPDAVPLDLPFEPDPRLAVFSPDGRGLLLQTRDRALVRVQLDTSAEAVETVLEGVLSESMGLSPDASRLAVYNDAQGVLVWDLRQPTAEPLRLSVETGSLFNPQLVFGPGGLLLAVDTDSALLWRLDGETPTEGTSLSDGLGLPAVFSPDGARIALLAENGEVVIVSANQVDARPLRLTSHEVIDLNQFALAFSSDGWSLLAHDSGTGQTRLWALTALLAEPRVSAVAEGATDMTTNSEGRLIVATYDGQIITFNPATEAQEQRLDFADLSPLRLSPDGLLLVARDMEGVVTLRRVSDGEVLASVAAPNEELGPNGVQFSANGKRLAVLSWRVLRDEIETEVDTGGFMEPQEQVFTLWDLSDPAAPEPTPAPVQQAGAFGLSPDGALLATATGGEVRLWSLDEAEPTPRELGTVMEGLIPRPTYVSFSPRGRYLAVVYSPGSIVLIDLQSEARQQLEFPGETVVQLLFTPDEQMVVALGAFTRRAWRLTAERAVPIDFPGVLTGGQIVAASGDGQVLYALDGPGRLFQWRLAEDELLATACAAAGRNLTAEEWDRSIGGDYAKSCPGQRVHPSLIRRAMELASDGRRADGEALLQYARNLEPGLAFDPAALLDQATASGLVTQGEQLSGQNEYEAALKVYRQAQGLDPSAVQSNTWLELCRAGAVGRAAAVVLPACDEAVAAMPGDPSALERRAQARALTDDREGAIADLEAFLALIEPGPRLGLTAEGAQWQLDELRAGRNPYTDNEPDGAPQG